MAWTGKTQPFGQNRQPALTGVSSVDGITVIPVAVNPATGALLTSGGGGSDTQYAELSTNSPATGTVALGRYQSSAPTLTTGQLYAPQLDVNGNLKVNIASGGGSGGTSSSFSSAFPSTGTAIGATDGTNMQPLKVDGSDNLLVKVNSALPAGTNIIGTAMTGQYQVSPPGTYTDGEYVPLLTDNFGQLKVVPLGTASTNIAQVNGSNVPGNYIPVSTAPATVNVGQQTVNTTAVQISSTSTVPTNGIIVRALAGNAANIYVGGSGVTTSTGYELAPGESISFTCNLNTLYIRSAASTTDKCCYNVE